MEATLGVRLQATGVEETKAALQDMRAQVLGVSSAKLEDARNTRLLSKDATILNNATRYQTQIFLAQHPVINNVSKAMSSFGRVARGALAITTAFSVASLAFGKTTSGLLELQGELAKARRDQSLALTRYGYDSSEYSEATDSVELLEAKVKELNDQTSQGQITNLINFGASIGIMGSSALTAVPHIKGLVTQVGNLLKHAGSKNFGKIGGLLGGGAAAGGGAKGLTGALTGAAGGAGAGAGGAIAAGGIMGAARTGGAGVALGLADAYGDITSITTIADKIMGTKMTDFFNKNIGQLIEGQMPDFFKLTAAALTGNQALIPEEYRKQPMATAGGSYKGAYGAPNITNITVQGSVISEKELYRTMDQYTKQDYKRRGFTG